MSLVALTRKPLDEIYLDLGYALRVKAFDTSRVYYGYKKFPKSEKHTYWKDVYVRPLTIFQGQRGDFYLEANYGLYRVIFQTA